LQAIGVANQTTMLRGETEEVQNRLKAAMIKSSARRPLTSISASLTRFAAPRRTVRTPCKNFCREPIDLLLVIGGYNSSEHVAPSLKWVKPNSRPISSKERGQNGIGTDSSAIRAA